MAAPRVNEDLPFRHYTFKHRVIAWISTNLFDHVTYTVQRGLLKGMKRKGGLAWLPESISPEVMTAEQKFWAGLDMSGMTVYDVGAFQALLTLHFAKRAKHVVCFEPNTRNHQRLTENLKLNGIANVKVHKVGVGSKNETLQMVASPLMLGGASVDSKVAEEIKRSGTGTFVEQIPIITLDGYIAEAALPKPDFIKIDIEGWEIEALRGARQTLLTHKPALYLEMHGETIREKKRKVSEIVDFLWDAGYRNIQHIETSTAITPQNSAVAMEGHLYCPAS